MLARNPPNTVVFWNRTMKHLQAMVLTAISLNYWLILFASGSLRNHGAWEFFESSHGPRLVLYICTLMAQTFFATVRPCVVWVVLSWKGRKVWKEKTAYTWGYGKISEISAQTVWFVEMKTDTFFSIFWTRFGSWVICPPFWACRGA